MKLSDKLNNFYSHLKKIQYFRSIEALLDWDQQVNLPENSSDWRASQCAFVAEMLHDTQSNDQFYSLCAELATYRDELNEDDAINVRETLDKIERERKLPKKLVIEKAKLTSSTYHLWVEARAENDFKKVSGSLDRLIALTREEARCTVVSNNLYDALLEIYEPGGRIEEIRPLLLNCADSVSRLLPEIELRMEGRKEIEGNFPHDKQREFCSRIASLLGFSFSEGRLDTAPHPFQATLGPYDFRITTRWDTENFLPALFGVIHEAGHALYERGLPKEWYGTPRGSPVSLGIHESQSRFWENIIGRSRPFADVLIQHYTEVFDEPLAATHIWEGANIIRPSLIRVEADEVTYTLHIVIRMILEEKLVEGDLQISDLPGAWSELYNKYLGISPSNDQEGVLQDIHWYSGNIGYFPTYALGNLYGALLYEKLQTEIPDTETLIRTGSLAPIGQWMIENVYRHGMLYRAPQLVEKVTGKPLSDEPFVRYLTEKFLQ